ncbi:MAG: HipA domain-containing protein [Lachnospiraceae bacterium]|nr:HipA domain-containing protein [Lachnospiraceae bacterium]
MSRCLCCGKEIINAKEYEESVAWHERCIKRFFGTKQLPELDCTDETLEKLANLTVNQGLTVPGVQKKLSLHLDSDGKKARLTVVNYPTGYILKPQSDEYESLPEAELLCMRMAEIAKIPVVPNALINLNGKYAYITKRIDRKDGDCYAMEDFCQLSGRMTEDKYRSSYENCGKVIKKYSRNVGLDIVELYYRLLFCFLIGNSDMHLKNFSLIEDTPGSRVYSLAEAYDMLPVNVILSADQEEMALTVNGKKRNIRKKDFLALAENLGITNKTALTLMKKLTSYKQAFLTEVRNSYIPKEMKESLIELMEKRIEIFSCANANKQKFRKVVDKG